MKLNPQRLEKVVFTVVPLPLDVLRNPHRFAMTHRARRSTKRGSGFPFAIAGENNQNPFFLYRRRDARIDLFLQFLLALHMPFS